MFRRRIVIDGLVHTLAKGGLHSENKPGIITPSEDEVIIDADVGSFYPAILVQLEIYPEHLGKEFCHIVDKIMKERLEAKAQKSDPKMALKAEALKIAINSIYGKMGNDYSYLLDKQALYSVTLNGQLFLLMLIEKLSLAGIRCIYSNTDGITCIVKKDKIDQYYEICNHWQKYTGFILEFVEYKKMYLKDVNNYLIIDANNQIKIKGDFSTKIDLSSGYDAPVVAKAVYEHLVNGASVNEFIRNHDNIYDFCMAQKTGPQFITEHHYIDGMEHKIDVLQKNNRYFVSNSGGYLYKKYKNKDKRVSLVAGFKITLFNDYFESDNYGVNYGYYTKRANDIILKLHNNFQTNLFS